MNEICIIHMRLYRDICMTALDTPPTLQREYDTHTYVHGHMYDTHLFVHGNVYVTAH